MSSFDLWYADDVRRILAGHAQQAAREGDDVYRRGYLDACQDIAVSFGVVQLCQQEGKEQQNVLEGCSAVPRGNIHAG